MNKDLVKTKRIKKDLSKIIRDELGYTNGWRIPEKDYENHCDKAVERIMRILKSRKILNEIN